MALILTVTPIPPDIHPKSSYPFTIFTSQECDDANEAELQGRVEALRRKARFGGGGIKGIPKGGEMWPGELVVKMEGLFTCQAS